MHKQSSEWTVETLIATAVGCFHGNAAAEESRDCGIPALYPLPEIKRNRANIELRLRYYHDVRSDHEKLAQTHSCFLKLF